MTAVTSPEVERIRSELAELEREKQRDPIAEKRESLQRAEAAAEAHRQASEEAERTALAAAEEYAVARDSLPPAFIHAVELVEDARVKRRAARTAISAARQYAVQVPLPAELAKVDKDHSRVNLLHRMGGSY